MPRGGRCRCTPEPAIDRERDIELVEQVAALRSEGLSFAAIAAELERRNVRTVRSGSRWYPASVRSILATRELEPDARAAA